MAKDIVIDADKLLLMAQPKLNNCYAVVVRASYDQVLEQVCLLGNEAQEHSKVLQYLVYLTNPLPLTTIYEALPCPSSQSL